MLAATAATLGAPPAVLASLSHAPEAEADFLVWPENWPAVKAFSAMTTQWRRQIDGMSGLDLWHGLRYECVEPVLRLLAIPRREWPDTFGRLRIMESAALELLNDRTGAA